jgi:hypothetical protein
MNWSTSFKFNILGCIQQNSNSFATRISIFVNSLFSCLQLKLLPFLLYILHHWIYFFFLLFRIQFCQHLWYLLESIWHVISTLCTHFHQLYIFTLAIILSFNLVNFSQLFRISLVSQNYQMNARHRIFFNLMVTLFLLLPTKNFQCPKNSLFWWYHRPPWWHVHLCSRLL